MTEADVFEFIAALPGVVAMTAGEENGAPEVAWGDSFFSYDPAGDIPAERRFPFATIVVSDYPGFDTASRLDRPDIFRVNIHVGRDAFTELFGYAPAEQARHEDGWDYAATDKLLPHPVYAGQGWASVLNPGDATGERTRQLLTEAHGQATVRQAHRPKT